MKHVAKLIRAVLLTMLLLGLICPIPAYAEDPEGGPMEGPTAGGIPIAPPAELDLERLAEELLRDGVPTSLLKDSALEQLPALSSSLKKNDPCYGFAYGTGTLCTGYPMGQSYPVGNSFTLTINTTPTAFLVIFKWQNGQWKYYVAGWLQGPGTKNFIEVVTVPRPGVAILIAVNLLNGDYAWYWYNVV